MASKGLRAGTERAKNELRETGRAVWRSPALVRCAEWLIRFLLSAVLAGGRVLADASPFGLALVGASGPGSGGFAALLGAVTGYLLSRGLEDGLRYAAGCVLVFSVSFAFFDLPVYRRGWFMPLAAGALNAVTGLVSVSRRAWGVTVAAGWVGEFALTVLGVTAFRAAFSLWRRPEDRREAGFRQRVGLVLLGMATLISLAQVEVLGAVSAGRLCACVVTLAAAVEAGPGAGAAVGLASGLAMDLAADPSRFYAVSYAFAGLTAGFFRRRSRPAAALSYTLASGLVLLWSWDAARPVSALWEVMAAALIFLLIPQRYLDQAAALFAGDGAPGREQWSAQTAAKRLRDTATAFDQVFAALKSAFAGPQDNGEDPSAIYDRAANRVCARCALRERCWQTGYQDTYDLLNGALAGILADGQARAEHFPQRFRDQCVRFAPFVSAVDRELQAHLLRRRYAAQVDQSRRALCSQYGHVARMLQDTAAAMAAPMTVDSARTRKLRQFLAGRELNCQGLAFFDQQGHLQVQLEGPDARELDGDAGLAAVSSLLDLPLAPAEDVGADQVVFRQREPLTATAGVAGKRRDGQSVSGDACAWFKDDGGTLHIILCDGMGSGPQAREDSDLTLRLLEKFLRAGVTAENALKTLDQALALRGEETGGFSTVDLLELDLFTGQGALYKLGAAPSYLKRGGAVTRLVGSALPAGLSAGDPEGPDRIPFQVGPGDCLVLLTDGVLDGDDQWLRAAISAFDGGSPSALAHDLVYREGGDDDKTALVLRMGLRPSGPEAAGKAPV